MTRGVLIVVALIVSLAVAAWLVGLLLPVAHVASRTATFAVPPDALYDILADRERYKEWWDDDTPTTVVESRRPERLVTRVVEGLPFGGTWTFEVVAEGNGSRLTITERGEVYNPLFRVMSRYVIGHTATIDRFLAALATRVHAR